MGTAVLGPLAQKTPALLSRPPCRLHPPPSVPLRSAATRHDSIAERPSARMAGPVQTSDGERAGGQRRGLRSERPQDGGSHRDPTGAERRGPRRCSPRSKLDTHRLGVPRSRQKKPGHPRGAGSARAVGRTGRRAGRPGPDGGNQLHPVVSPQFSHLWQVPLRTVSQPQRGQGGASGVELSRR